MSAGSDVEVVSLRGALLQAAKGLYAAHQMLSAICESDGDTQRVTARDRAWEAYGKAKDAYDASMKGVPHD